MVDGFDGDWTRVGGDVLLATVLNADVVPMSTGQIALLVRSSMKVRHPAAPDVGLKLQVAVSPDYARRLMARIAEAVNVVSPQAH